MEIKHTKCRFLINISEKGTFFHRFFIKLKKKHSGKKFVLIWNIKHYIIFYYIYGFIQYYKTIQFLFCDKSSYCTANFKIYQPIVFYVRCNDVTQTQTRQLEKQSGKEVLQMQQNANMQFVHTELVQVFHDIKWISSEIFEFEKNQQTIPKNRFRYTK
jgi:hypothetical protein